MIHHLLKENTNHITINNIVIKKVINDNTRVIALHEKIARYEELLHDIQMYAEVTLDNEKLKKLIGNICAWSYAHRSGNGELTEQEQDARVRMAFDKLRKV